nr:hypothetical protein [Tanacetum cinerariifolium]
MRWEEKNKYSVTNDDLMTKKLIKFRLGGREHTLTLLEFARRLGLYHFIEKSDRGFKVYFQGGLHSDENFNARDYWLSISSEEELHLSRSLTSNIRSHVLKFITRMARRMNLLNDEVLDGFSASTYCRALDATTLKELIGSNGRLIAEDPASGSHVINIPQLDVEYFTSWKDSDSDVEEETKSNSEFLADLNVEIQDRAHLANQKRFYKISGRVEDEGVTRVKSFIAIAEDEPVVGKTHARKHVLDYTNVDLHYVEDQRKNLLNKFNSLKQELLSCKSELIDLKKPLPPLPKLSGVETIGTSKDVLPPNDLIQTSTISDKTKQVTKKESSVKIIKKKAQTKTSFVPNPSLERKADSSIEQLLLTSMKELKRLKE